MRTRRYHDHDEDHHSRGVCSNFTVNVQARQDVVALNHAEWAKTRNEKDERTPTQAGSKRFTLVDGKSRMVGLDSWQPVPPHARSATWEWKGAVRMLTLREARLRRRMSQQSLADSAGVARVTVSQIELGKSGPRPHIARRLAEALGFQPSEIVEFSAAAQSMRLPSPSILAELEGEGQSLS